MRYLMVVLLFVISCATTRPEIVFELPPQEIIHTVAVEINGVKGQFEFCDDGEMWDTTVQIHAHFLDKYPSIWITTYYKCEGGKIFIGLLRFHSERAIHGMNDYGMYDGDAIRRMDGRFEIQWIELETIPGGFKIGDLKGKWR
jgi:hypothetical protein